MPEPMDLNRRCIGTLRQIVVSCLLLCAGALAWSVTARLHHGRAAQPEPIWQPLERAEAARRLGRALREGERVLRLDGAALERVLAVAPHESAGALRDSRALLSLPLPGGGWARFRIEESPVMEKSLAALFPQIKSYRGEAVDAPGMTLRFDWSPAGLHAWLLANGQMTSVIPAGGAERALYLSQNSADGRGEAVQCLTREVHRADAQQAQRISIGGQLRTYRVAVAATFEYCNFYGGGTNAGAQASLNTWFNAINAIYEKELSIHLNLVNNVSVLYTAERGFNAGSDPFDNANAEVLRDQARAVLRANVGENNYDLGHVFAAGGIGGIAYLGVVCNNAEARNSQGRPDGFGPLKGGGASRLGGPVGSGALVTLLAHEFGHQFGADHSFNATSENCGSGRSGASAWESGAGLTLMSYATSCPSNPISTANDLRFHNGSFNQIIAHVTGGSGAACAGGAATGNTPPVVNGGADFIIPKQTPFTLTAGGNDADAADAANLTYAWEQLDAGQTDLRQGKLLPRFPNPPYTDAGDPPTTTRPIFRPFPATTHPARTFPSLPYILNHANVPPTQVGGLFTAESLPQVGRQLNFRVTVRDQRGGVADDSVTLTVAGDAGPFSVTAPNTAVVWTTGSAQTVTWNVANTAAAPVNAANVSIKLSLDGGQSFALTLAESTPNDGSETITVPAGLNSARARVRIEAAGNIFFDISDANFHINAGANCPFVTGVAPGAGNAGTNVTLTGTGFTGVSGVFFNNVAASALFSLSGDTQLLASTPLGARSGPLTLSKAGCPNVTTESFVACPNPPQSLQLDDGASDVAVAAGKAGQVAYFVNRLTPANYPATLSGVLLRFEDYQELPEGAAINLVTAAHPSDSATLNGLNLQTTPARISAFGQFVSYDVPPLTINAGDFVVGFSLVPQTAAALPALVDTDAAQGRSYISTDGGTFSSVATIGAAGNLLIRARVFTACPAINVTPANLNAASFAGNGFAPESIVAAFGSELATASQAAAATPLPTALAGTGVRLRDSQGVERLAPLFFVSPAQVNYLIPAGLALGRATVTIANPNGVRAGAPLDLVEVAPGLFTANANGSGAPAAVVLRVKPDGTQRVEPAVQFNPATNRFDPAPIDLGAPIDPDEQVFVIGFGTGFRGRSALANVNCTLGGVAAEVSYAGAQGDFPGLDQFNLKLPRSLSGRGNVELVFIADGKRANAVTLNIK